MIVPVRFSQFCTIHSMILALAGIAGIVVSVMQSQNALSNAFTPFGIFGAISIALHLSNAQLIYSTPSGILGGLVRLVQYSNVSVIVVTLLGM